MEIAEDILSGAIEHIVFSSEETGFTVARIKIPRQKDPICIVGSMPGVQPGETILCRGMWKHHPAHGRQFEVRSFELRAPADLIGIQKYLESGLIKGIGPVYAKRIIDQFGVQTLDIIDKSPSKLSEISGLGEKRIETITKYWKDQKSIRQVMIFLRSHEVSPSLAQKIFKTYGENSIEKVKENPFSLAREIFGIGFKTADKIAQNLGIPRDSPIRIDAGIEHLLWELANDGHICYPEKELSSLSHQTLEIDEEKIKERIQSLVHEERLIRHEFPSADGIFHYIWIKPLYLSEIGIARELRRLLSQPCSLRSIDLERAENWIEAKLGLKFATSQKDAIAFSLKEKIHIITGGPGTGKSTITSAILKITEKLTDHILLAAPTGRAAKRLSEITGKKAHTIHSLLEFNFHEGGFKYGKNQPLKADLVIIDEASMIDTQLMYSLLKAIPTQCRIIFIGDIDQLPSVGPGNVLRDMIDSNTLVVTRLTEIFRQGAGSQIIINAHRVNEGNFPFLSQKDDSDFYFLESDTPEDILGKIRDLILFKLPQKFKFHPIDDIQVLSPMKRGIIGIENLNALLQKELNPSDYPLLRMGRSFHMGDKIMQIRNNYDKSVFNGDIGRIRLIDTDEHLLLVDFEGKQVEYDFSEIDELALAYAVSVHKYQGSECPCIIMPVHTTHFKLLYRNLLYTGITRGKKLVILIGTKKALAIAIKNNDVHKRHTGLKRIIREMHAFDLN